MWWEYASLEESPDRWSDPIGHHYWTHGRCGYCLYRWRRGTHVPADAL